MIDFFVLQKFVPYSRDVGRLWSKICLMRLHDFFSFSLKIIIKVEKKLRSKVVRMHCVFEIKSSKFHLSFGLHSHFDMKKFPIVFACIC